MFLGIEIGGTKLQLGIGRGNGSPLVAIQRLLVDPERGAEGILHEIQRVGGELIAAHGVTAVGIGFGGPVDSANGRVVKSHHVHGWDDFPLVAWCHDKWNLPIALENDCDAAGLAEARFGAGQGRRIVFYVTVGTGIGGGLVVDGTIYRGGAAGAAEIGHLRPGLNADSPDQTVESVASGWGIAAAAQARLSGAVSHAFGSIAAGLAATDPDQVRQRLIEVEEANEASCGDLLERCGGRIEHLTARMVAQAAAAGNHLAQRIMARACQTLGWAIAQTITLVSPQVVVLGGGVSLADESLFLLPLRAEVARYVFPPLLNSYQIERAGLGEEVVVHGALAAAADLSRPPLAPGEPPGAGLAR
jgi:glucokinase